MAEARRVQGLAGASRKSGRVEPQRGQGGGVAEGLLADAAQLHIPSVEVESCEIVRNHDVEYSEIVKSHDIEHCEIEKIHDVEHCEIG